MRNSNQDAMQTIKVPQLRYSFPQTQSHAQIMRMVHVDRSLSSNPKLRQYTVLPQPEIHYLEIPVPAGMSIRGPGVGTSRMKRAARKNSSLN